MGAPFPHIDLQELREADLHRGVTPTIKTLEQSSSCIYPGLLACRGGQDGKIGPSKGVYVSSLPSQRFI